MDESGSRELQGAFSAAIAEMKSIPAGAERHRHLRGLATLLVGQAEAFRAAAVSELPELVAVEPFPDTLLDPEEQELVSQLTQADLDAIDAALLRSSALAWRKAARVVGEAMAFLEGRLPVVSLGLFVQRIGSLAGSGELVAKGDISFMRLCEVRLPAVEELTSPSSGSVKGRFAPLAAPLMSNVRPDSCDA